MIDAEEIAGKGLRIRAVVDPQPETSAQFPAYQAIKNGRATHFSIGGIFKRKTTPAGPRINDVDILEVSACGIPSQRTASRPFKSSQERP